MSDTGQPTDAETVSREATSVIVLRSYLASQPRDPFSDHARTSLEDLEQRLAEAEEANTEMFALLTNDQRAALARGENGEETPPAHHVDLGGDPV